MKLLRSAAILSCLQSAVCAQDYAAALDHAALTYPPGQNWTVTGANLGALSVIGSPASAYDSTDAVISGPFFWNVNGPQASGSTNLTVSVNGPGTVSWWWMPLMGTTNQASGFQSVSASGLAGPAPSLTDPFWNQATMELGPGMHSLTWTVNVFGNPGAFSADSMVNSPYLALDELTTAPAAAASLAAALDLAGGSWATSSTAAWQGAASSLAADSVDYAWMTAPPSPGGEGWVERSFTGPLRVSWKWRRDTAGGSLRALIDGTTAVTHNAGDTGWVLRFADIPAGDHTLRWAATSPADGTPAAVALDSVTTGSSPAIPDMLGTPGRTWTTGGNVPPAANDASGIAGHSTVVSFLPGAGQSSTLETSVTGPGHVTFWAQSAGFFEVTLAGATLPAAPAQPGANGLYRLSVPAGNHTLQFRAANAAASLDDFVLDTVALTVAGALDVPALPVLEVFNTGFTSWSVVSGAAWSGGFALSGTGPHRVVLPAGSAGVPSVLSLLRQSDANLQVISSLSTTVLPAAATATTARTLLGQDVQTLTLTSDSGALVLDALTVSPAAPATLAAAIDNALPLAISLTGAVQGIAGDGAGFDAVDCVWLQGTPAGQPAWLQFTVTGPAQVDMRTLGTGEISMNGGTPSAFSGAPWSNTTLVVLPGAPATIRVTAQGGGSTAARNGLFVDVLTITRPVNVSLDEALEHPGWTTGGQAAWTGVSYAPWGPDDFALAPALLPGQSAWVEATLPTGSTFTFAAPESGDSLRLEIDGVLHADSALCPANVTTMTIFGNGTARRCRWIATRSASASGPSLLPARLYTAAPGVSGNDGDHAFAGANGNPALRPDAVFWSSGWTDSTIGHVEMPYPPLFAIGTFATASRSAEFGLFVHGPGTLTFTCDVMVSNQGTPLQAPYAAASCSLRTGGAPVNLTSGAASRTFTAEGLTCAIWSASKLDSIENYAGNHFLGTGNVQLSLIRWLPGNAAWRTWGAARGLTGFSLDPAADSDGDGIIGGIEFLLGTEPGQSASTPVLTPALAAGPVFRLTAPKPPWSTAGSSLNLQTSPDLSSWADAPPGALVSENAVSRTWEVPATARLFARLRALITP